MLCAAGGLSGLLLLPLVQLPSLSGLLQAKPDPNTPKTGPFLYVWAAYGKSCEWGQGWRW